MGNIEKKMEKDTAWWYENYDDYSATSMEDIQKEVMSENYRLIREALGTFKVEIMKEDPIEFPAPLQRTYRQQQTSKRKKWRAWACTQSFLFSW